MLKSILVTGAAGFTGSNLVDRLLFKGHNVIGLDNFDKFYGREIKEQNLNDAKSNSNFKFIEIDIRDDKEIKKLFTSESIDIIIHLAAKAGVRPSIENPREYYSVNVDGTLNILENMKACGIKKLIFASSSSVYGNNKKVPFSEDDKVDFPISPYAASKMACELLCHTYHHLYQFDIFCLRFFTVYGRRQRPDLAIHKFTSMIMNDKKIPLYGDGSSKRDYTYIDDILDGIESSIERLSGFEIINLGESNTIKLLDLIHVIECNLDKKADIQYLNKQPGDVDITFADISKAAKLLDYRPSMGIEDGIKKFIEWKTK